MARAITFRRHWTPRYVVDRSALWWRQRRRPDEPWLTASMVAFLDQWLRPTDEVLEWGARRSTRWFADRVARVQSVEHDPTWAAEVAVATERTGNVHLAAVPAEDVSRYVAAWSDPVDLALIDGIHRDRCALRALDLVRPGGLVVVDNAERYLPNTSRGPESIGDATLSSDWTEFVRRVAGWRRVWTSDGVTDTAAWFVPPAPH